MALDPNFALRTYRTLKANNNPLWERALQAVPKCTFCGKAVKFGQGNQATHVDNDVSLMDHTVDARRPTDEELLAMGHPVPKAADPKPAGRTRTPRTPAEPASSTNPIVTKGRAKLGPKLTQGQRTQINIQVGNRNLGRQWSPELYDEDGFMRPAAEIFNGGSQEGKR